MSDRAWGHCQHCRYFASPSRRPLEAEEAACEQPELSQFRLRVFGASGCNAFERRAGISEAEETPASRGGPGW